MSSTPFAPARPAPTPSATASAPPLPMLTPRGAARVAGLGYVALFVLAILANFVVVEGMVVADDPTATVAAIAADPGLFRLGIAAFLVIAVVDVLVAWALHGLLRDVAPDRSLLAAWLRVLHSVFLGVGLASLFQVDHLVATGGSTATAAPQVMLALDTFDAMWMVGLAFFGLHLVAVTSLLGGPRGAPRVLRVVLAVAGAAYVIDTLAHTLFAGYDTVASLLLVLVAVPSVLGEGWFGLWLLRRGFSRSQPQST